MKNITVKTISEDINSSELFDYLCTKLNKNGEHHTKHHTRSHRRP